MLLSNVHNINRLIANLQSNAKAATILLKRPGRMRFVLNNVFHKAEQSNMTHYTIRDAIPIAEAHQSTKQSFPNSHCRALTDHLLDAA